ncbi:MAG: hypothetical protein JJU02_01825 [Cryomorphaceae bacterium]|nr:hypothetical protein [Cryomorphaceae bacterium]
MRPNYSPFQGVYFLANDRVLPLCIAFLNSFRARHPELSLCLIPYDTNIEKLRALAERYNFFVFENSDLLNRCDKISLNFHPYIFGHYRKLALWEGPFSQFVYMDIDTVLLNNLDQVFDLLKDFDLLTATSNIPHTRKWVWHDSIDETNLMLKEEIDFAANTGFIASHKDKIPLSRSEELLQEAETLIPHMNLYCFEQSFLNYCMAKSNIRKESLSELGKINNRIMKERWAGDKGGQVVDGKITFEPEEEILFLHWAGVWQKYPRELRWEKRFKKWFGIRPKNELVSRFMPYKSLWLYYRNMDTSRLKLKNHV